MVKKLSLFIIFLLVGGPVFASSPSFTATVDNNSVAQGQGFTLELSLSGAEAKSAPDMSPLRQDFTVASQGQSSNTTIVNGQVTSSTGWELTLVPKAQGEVTIPPLAIETSEGTLHTQPVTMEVEQASVLPSQSKGAHTTVTAHVSTPSPYKNQPILYTARIVARDNIADLTLGDLKMNNAIVESQGKPRMHDATENGMPVKVIDLRYLITPLDAGDITIPPLLLQGRMQVAAHDPFIGAFSSDPFAMLQQMDRMGGFMSTQPFSLASNAVRLNVKPAAVSMDPWLPLSSLTIKDDMDILQSVNAGEPVTRKITLTADGAVGRQLPSLEAQQDHTDFKVYADKPVTSESIKGETIVGMRTESYSLVPLKPGKLTLPAIRVPWWDVHNNRIAYAELAARTLDVLPGAGASSEPAATTSSGSASEAPKPVTQAQPVPAVPQPLEKNTFILYAAIGILLVALAGVVLWAMRLRKGASFVTGNAIATHGSGPQLSSVKAPAPDMSDLADVKSAEELNRFIREYAHDRWGTQMNAPLEAIFSGIILQDEARRQAVHAFIHDLTTALYAGKETCIDIEGLKVQYRSILGFKSRKHNGAFRTSESLPGLNPN